MWLRCGEGGPGSAAARVLVVVIRGDDDEVFRTVSGFTGTSAENTHTHTHTHTHRQLVLAFPWLDQSRPAFGVKNTEERDGIQW